MATVKLHDSDWTIKSLLKNRLFSIIPKFFFVDAKTANRFEFPSEFFPDSIAMTEPRASQPPQHGTKFSSMLNSFFDSVCRAKTSAPQTYVPQLTSMFSEYLTVFSAQRKFPDLSKFPLSRSDYEESIAVEKSLEMSGGFPAVSNGASGGEFSAVSNGASGGGFPAVSNEMCKCKDFFRKFQICKDNSTEGPLMERKNCLQTVKESCCGLFKNITGGRNNQVMEKPEKKPGLSATRREKKRRRRNNRRSRSNNNDHDEPAELIQSIPPAPHQPSRSSSSKRRKRKTRRRKLQQCDSIDETALRLSTSSVSEDECDGFRTMWFAQGILDIDEGVDLQEPEPDITVEIIKADMNPLITCIVRMISDSDDDWDCWDEEDCGTGDGGQDFLDFFQNCGLNADNLTRCVNSVTSEVTSDVSEEIRNANQRWLSGLAAPDCDKLVKRSTKNPRKKVCFAEDDELVSIHWVSVEECRKGPWEEIKRDRERFQRKIDELEPVLSRVLEEEHRSWVRAKIDEWVAAAGNLVN